jgi:hypothetical protein
MAVRDVLLKGDRGTVPIVTSGLLMEMVTVNGTMLKSQSYRYKNTVPYHAFITIKYMTK